MIEQVNNLDEILEPRAGQTIYVASEDKCYRYDPIEGWGEIQIDGGLKMSAYDINKQIIGQLEILDAEALQEKKKMVREYITNNGNYFMLLCRDINYYTIFHKVHPKEADDVLENVLIDECLPALGAIKAIDRTEDGAIEIWWQDEENNVYAAYFFPYDVGVIVCA